MQNLTVKSDLTASFALRMLTERGVGMKNTAEQVHRYLTLKWADVCTFLSLSPFKNMTFYYMYTCRLGFNEHAGRAVQNPQSCNLFCFIARRSGHLLRRAHAIFLFQRGATEQEILILTVLPSE